MSGLGSDTGNFLEREAIKAGVDLGKIPPNDLRKLHKMAEDCIDAGRNPEPEGPCKEGLMVNLQLQLAAHSS